METKPTRKRRRRPRLGGSVSEASVLPPWVILPPVEVAVVEMASMVAEREKIWWMNVCWLRRREEWRRPRTRQSRAQSRAATTWMTPALATLLTRGPRGAQAPGQKALLVCVCKCAGLVCGCLFFSTMHYATLPIAPSSATLSYASQHLLSRLSLHGHGRSVPR